MRLHELRTALTRILDDAAVDSQSPVIVEGYTEDGDLMQGSVESVTTEARCEGDDEHQAVYINLGEETARLVTAPNADHIAAVEAAKAGQMPGADGDGDSHCDACAHASFGVDMNCQCFCRQCEHARAKKRDQSNGDGSRSVSVGASGDGDALRGRSGLGAPGEAGLASGGAGAVRCTSAADAREGRARPGPAAIPTADLGSDEDVLAMTAADSSSADGPVRSLDTPEVSGWAVNVIRHPDGLYRTVFSVGVQHFTIAQADDEEAEDHCEGMRRMLLHALGNLGVAAPGVACCVKDCPLPVRANGDACVEHLIELAVELERSSDRRSIIDACARAVEAAPGGLSERIEEAAERVRALRNSSEFTRKEGGS